MKITKTVLKFNLPTSYRNVNEQITSCLELRIMNVYINVFIIRKPMNVKINKFPALGIQKIINIKSGYNLKINYTHKVGNNS